MLKTSRKSIIEDDTHEDADDVDRKHVVIVEFVNGPHAGTTDVYPDKDYVHSPMESFEIGLAVTAYVMAMEHGVGYGIGVFEKNDPRRKQNVYTIAAIYSIDEFTLKIVCVFKGMVDPKMN